MNPSPDTRDGFIEQGLEIANLLTDDARDTFVEQLADAWIATGSRAVIDTYENKPQASRGVIDKQIYELLSEHQCRFGFTATSNRIRSWLMQSTPDAAEELRDGIIADIGEGSEIRELLSGPKRTDAPRFCCTICNGGFNAEDVVQSDAHFYCKQCFENHVAPTIAAEAATPPTESTNTTAPEPEKEAPFTRFMCAICQGVFPKKPTCSFRVLCDKCADVDSPLKPQAEPEEIHMNSRFLPWVNNYRSRLGLPAISAAFIEDNHVKFTILGAEDLIRTAPDPE